MTQSEQAPILIEDEGSKIGARHISRPLWHAMEQAPVIVLEATQEERIEQSLNDYVLTMLNDYRRILPDEATAQQALREHIVSSLNRVQKRLGGLRHRAFMALADEALNQFCESQILDGLRQLIGKLLIEYYDPMYDYQLGKKHNRILFSGNKTEIHYWLIEHGFTVTH
jgi:tRNA 2-selenouridine synthase